MQNQNSSAIAITLAISTIIILIAVCFIAAILVFYQKRQFFYLKEMDRLKISYEKDILKLHLEIQEQTFENISQEIHDNIGQVLTLAKFNLNTIDINDSRKTLGQIDDSVKLLTEAITDLSDISRSLSSEIILQNGLIRALEFEFERINHLESIHIGFMTIGDSLFIDSRQELTIFRIIQEALNNAVRHSMAANVQVNFLYLTNSLEIEIIDDGRGFNINELEQKDLKLNAGIRNMEKRTKILNGQFEIIACAGRGTTIKICMPIKMAENE